jgi:hypothetical protein
MECRITKTTEPKMFKIQFFKLFLVAFGFFASEVYSQEIISLNVEPEKIIEGVDVNLIINLSKASTGENVWCGLKIDFGNGESKEVRIGLNGEKDLKYIEKFAYKDAGTYTASVQGLFLLRGIKSSPSCLGAKKIVRIVVSPKKSEIQAQPKSLVTADLPSSFNAPIDQDKLQTLTASNAGFRDAIQAFTMKKVESVTLMMLQANQGEPFAQFFYGLAHTENWTNIYDKKMACYWFRQAAVAGVSQARLYLAIKAFKEKDCFDVPPTIEQAKVWAQLAGMSNDQFVKAEAEKLLQEILKFQIEKGGK